MARIPVVAGSPQTVSASASDQKQIISISGTVSYFNTEVSGSLTTGQSVTVESNTTLTVASGKGYAYILDVPGSPDSVSVASLPSEAVVTTGATSRQVPWLDPDTGRFAWRDPDLFNVKYFGATGDGSTDDTAAIQAAIDYVEDNHDKYRGVYFPTGNYIISGVTATTASLVGEESSRTLQGAITNVTTQFFGTRFVHKLNATTPLVTMAGNLTDNKGWERCERIAFIGRQNRNLTVSKKSIVSAASRTQFTISTSDVPTAPDTVLTFPYYGMCVFYDANGQRLGTGIVKTVNSGTGVVTLETGTDNYTGITGSSNLLTSTEKVAFAPLGTYTADGYTHTNIPDSTMLSPPAILVMGRTKIIRQVDVRDFHCPVVFGATVGHIENFWAHNFQMAGIAMRTLGSGADIWADKIFLQGRGYEGYGESARSIGVIDPQGHWSTCGLWGLPSISHYGEVCIEATVHGIVDKGAAGAHFDYLLLDGCWKEPIVTWGGIWNSGTSSPLNSIGHLQVRTPLSGLGYTPWTTPTYPSGERTVFGIVAADSHRKWHVGVLHVNRGDSGSDSGFDYASVVKYANTPVNGYHEVIIERIPFQGAVTSKMAAAGLSPRPGMYCIPRSCFVQTQAVTANRGHIARFEPQRDMVVTSIAFSVSVAAGSDDEVCVGIYDDAGTRLVTSGAVTGKLNGSTGRKTVTITATTLRAGKAYYLGISTGTQGSTAATLGSVTPASAGAGALFGTTIGLVETDAANSAHPLPSTWSIGGVSSSGLLGAVLE